MVARKSPGRPPELNKPILITARLPAKLIKRLDAFARRRKAASRSAALRFLLEWSLEEMAREDRAGRRGAVQGRATVNESR